MFTSPERVITSAASSNAGGWRLFVFDPIAVPPRQAGRAALR
jgi:hypothetical protein